MPIYDFLCPACGHRQEMLVKLDETPDCPACKGSEMERQLSLSAGVSTGRTRTKANIEARQIRSGLKAEQDRANAEYMRKHNEDHH